MSSAADIRGAIVPARRRWVPALLFLIIAPTPLVAQRNAVEGTIRGRVNEQTTGAGIAGVEVQVLDDKERIRRTAVSDEEGNFVLTRVAAGRFWLRANRLGYARTKTPAWWVESGEVLSVTIRMDREVVPLAPLEVTARTRTNLSVLSAFQARMQRRMGGTFFSRADIEARNPSRVTDLLVNVTGLEVQNSGGNQHSRIVTMARALPATGGGRGSAGRSCPVQIYVDGTLATRSGAVSPDDLAAPGSLEGVEVYRGLSTVPPEFLTPEARCGVIALWTRRGG